MSKAKKYTLEWRLDQLMITKEKKWIPPRDRAFFWTTFKSLKEQGTPYDKAWDFTCIALLHHYGFIR